jgi:hypothetical protein
VAECLQQGMGQTALARSSASGSPSAGTLRVSMCALALLAVATARHPGTPGLPSIQAPAPVPLTSPNTGATPASSAPA